MFGLFKSSTPESRLASDLRKSLEQEISIAIKESKGNEIIGGIFIDRAISYVYKAYTDNASLLSAGHGISFQKTIEIIKKVTNEVRNKYLVNPTPIV